MDPIFVERPHPARDRVQRWSGLRLRPVAVVLVACSMVGCATSGPMEPLEITLADLQVSEVTVFETTLLAKLRITNPNPEPFSVAGASFKLVLDDRKIGSGTTPETFVVERLDSAVVDAVFHLNNASVLLRLKDIFGRQDVSYGIQGSLFTEGTFGTRRMRVEKTGRLDLSDVTAPAAERTEIN